MAEPDSEMEEHRYSHLMSATQKREFRETFVLFDYDGGGDVDLRELGMMLRKLGQAPSDAELAQMINDFDYDKSGTIDIEEFCGMMLASVRAAAMPKWLVARCDPPEGESQLELCYKPGESGSLRRPLSLDQQLFVIDQQRRNKHLTALSLSAATGSARSRPPSSLTSSRTSTSRCASSTSRATCSPTRARRTWQRCCAPTTSSRRSTSTPTPSVTRAAARCSPRSRPGGTRSWRATSVATSCPRRAHAHRTRTARAPHGHRMVHAHRAWNCMRAHGMRTACAHNMRT